MFPIKTYVYIFCIFYCVIARFIAGLLYFLWGGKYGREALTSHDWCQAQNSLKIRSARPWKQDGAVRIGPYGISSHKI